MWRKTGRILNKRIQDIAAVLLIVCLLASIVDVLNRIFVGYSLPWSHTISIWTMEVFVFLLCGVLIMEHGHIKVDIIINRLKGMTKKIYADWIINIINIIVCVIAVYSGVIWMQHCIDFTFRQQVGVWYVIFWPVILVSIVLGMSIAVIYSVITLIHDVRTPVEKPEKSKGKEEG